MTLELQATPEEVMRAVDALRDFGRANGVPESLLFGLTLALEECGSNIVNHALGRDARRRFEVSFARTRNELTIELRDPGAEFDPTTARVPEPAANGTEREAGGWGILLVRHYIDEIRYRREANWNVLLLRKSLIEPVDKK